MTGVQTCALPILIPKCNKYLVNNQERILVNKYFIEEKIKEITKKGIRVLVIAYKNGNEELSDLVFLGLILLKDELRNEAKKGVNLIKSASIKVVMITGDAKETAKNIATEVGILDNENDLVLTSKELNELSDDLLLEKLDNLKVVSRALPSDKTRLVKLYQKKDLIVGMTGDGVNDAPALKNADVGFSMGSGSEEIGRASCRERV